LSKFEFKRANAAVKAAAANRMAISDRIRFSKMRENQPVPYAHWVSRFPDVQLHI
jgi:hypothetical protein